MKFSHFSLNLNNFCNMSCIYCFYSKEKGEISDEVIKQLPEFLSRYWPEQGKRELAFFGVEPMLSWDKLVKVTETVLSRFPRTVFGLTTNLTLMTPERARWLKAHGFYVNSSFDGLWQDRYRVFPDGSGSSELCKRGLRYLKEAGDPLYILCSMVPGEEPRFKDNVVWLYNTFKPRMIAMNKVVDSYDVEYDWDELERQFLSIAEWYAKLFASDPSFCLQFIYKTAFYNAPRSSRSRWTCGACWGSLGVDWDGRIYICHRALGFPEFQVGDIWEGVDEEKVRWFRSQVGFWRCRYCPAHPCSGCYVINKLTTGDLLRPPEAYCRYEIIRWKAGLRFKQLYSKGNAHVGQITNKYK